MDIELICGVVRENIRNFHFPNCLAKVAKKYVVLYGLNFGAIFIFFKVTSGAICRIGSNFSAERLFVKEFL